MANVSKRAVAVVVTLALSAAAAVGASADQRPWRQPELGTRSVPLLTSHGRQFKDLNRNGRVDPYEDWRRSTWSRARDLLASMTLAEKAGLMVHHTAPSTTDAAGTPVYNLETARAIIVGKNINHMVTRMTGPGSLVAAASNSLQQVAEESRLGIPVTLSSDPRNHFQYVPGASEAAGSFSQWPETLGMAAIGSRRLVRRFGDIARQEYLAVGFREALSPQADLATEPRWPRINGTFGEDARLARRLVKAYVEGFQGGRHGVGRDSVASIVKHWAGYGASANGLDAHNAYAKYAQFSSNRAFWYHVLPFTGAFAANVAGVMPTYAILRGVSIGGQPLEQVGGGFNRQLLTELLRNRFAFDGVILSDWAITNDCNERCQNGAPPGEMPSPADIGMPWGVEDLAKVDRFAKGIRAGLDQVGGTDETQYIVEAVNSGRLSGDRLDRSVLRLLRVKFAQGLFENPYVDPAAADEIVGNPGFQAQASSAQRRSLVLLENKGRILPLHRATERVYLHNVDRAAAERHGFTVVDRPQDADVAIVRTSTPYERLHPGYFFGSRQHEGDLDFKDGNPDYEAMEQISAVVPTVVTVYLDRPAVLTNIRDKAAALVGNFGIGDDALLDVLTGRGRPQGRLPFELPRSMAAVEAQDPSLPHDSIDPLYPIFYGLRY
jgi:beta-glucosidase